MSISINAALMLIFISLIAAFPSTAAAAQRHPPKTGHNVGLGESARARRFAGDARIGCATAWRAAFFPLACRPRYPIFLLDAEWSAPGLRSNDKKRRDHMKRVGTRAKPASPPKNVGS